MVFPGGSAVKKPPTNEGDTKASEIGSVPGLGRSTRGGNVNPLLCSCLENPTNGRVWLAIVHRVEESQLNEHVCKQIWL